jgi:hypothetical protein
VVAFDAPPGSRRLTVRSRVAAQLLPGHRQLLSVRTMTGELVLERMLDAASAAIDVDLSTASRQSKARSFGTLGVTHILGGYDHLLFVGALLLGVRRLGEALRTITAFTVAHSVTLALAALGLASVTSRIVEPLIAASIVFVALDNLRRGKTGSRLGLTFAFGLMHGFGFAGALRDAGLQPGLAVVVPLAWFNLGVEAGQLLVAIAMWPVVVLLFVPRARSLRLAPACSLLVAAFGAYWLVERTLS